MSSSNVSYYDLNTRFREITRKWPRKRAVQMLNFALATTCVIVILKYLTHGIRLRSSNEVAKFPLTFSSKHLDLNNFYWVSNNESICNLDDGTRKLLPILIFSARDHFLERQAIRRTYGSLSRFMDWSIRVVFLLGMGHTDNTSELHENDKRINDEAYQFGDVVIGNFADTYKNLTYKHIMGYRWILEFCSYATFVWKVDDDMLLDPLTAIRWRDGELQRYGGKSSNQKLIDFYCAIQENAEPQRDVSLKWYVPFELWSLPKFPNYCSGWAYGVNVDWIRRIYQESLQVKKIFWIDDLFVTGVLVNRVEERENVHPRLKNIWGYATFRYDPWNTTFCVHNDNGVISRTSTRKFGLYGRFLRGENFSREITCVWHNIISGKWGPIDIKLD